MLVETVSSPAFGGVCKHAAGAPRSVAAHQHPPGSLARSQTRRVVVTVIDRSATYQTDTLRRRKNAQKWQHKALLV